MQKELRMQREVAHLTEQDFKKLFPAEYFSKYAGHQSILAFEDTLFNHALPSKPPNGTFTQRRRGGSMGNLHAHQAPRLSRFDPVEDTIAKNKLQAVRMQKFVRHLTVKMREGPTKNTMTIRTPLSGFGEVPPAVMDKMCFLEDEQYAKELQRAREKRNQQKEFVRFKHRSNSTFSLRIPQYERSIQADSAESRSITPNPSPDPILTSSNTLQLHPFLSNPSEPAEPLSYQDRLNQLMSAARSEVTNLNPESPHVDVQYIMALNRSIRKMNLLQDTMRSERRRTGSRWHNREMQQGRTQGEEREKKRKNLIAMTQEIRKEGEQVILLSRYQELLKGRQLKQFLKKETLSKTIKVNK